jgi:alpha-D-ribose 1-methylphosphonate 5-triphosphate diphosphatase
MTKKAVLYNAKLVLPDQTVSGAVILSNGNISDIDIGNSICENGIDCRGDYLIPGLIEIHTDNLEKYIVPRPGILWPYTEASLIAHDNQIFGSGITTVFDAISIGLTDSSEVRTKIIDKSINAVKKTREEKLLKADHYIHLRCELPSSTVYNIFLKYVDEPLLRFVSLMDHTVGQRQWRDIRKWKLYYSDRKWTDEDASAEIEKRERLHMEYANKNRKKIMNICNILNIPTASHDDTLPEHCYEAWKNGVTISEFPTTLEAAIEAKKLGMKTIMGAPNMIRGESHSGNISAISLVENNLLDGFSSDYMPISLLHAAFQLHTQVGMALHRAIKMVTSNIAQMVNLNDRGSLEKGKISDIVRVKIVDNLPVVKAIWKNGNLINSSIDHFTNN